MEILIHILCYLLAAWLIIDTLKDIQEEIDKRNKK